MLHSYNIKIGFNYNKSPTFKLGSSPNITFKSLSQTGSVPNLAKVSAEKNAWHRSLVSVNKI